MSLNWSVFASGAEVPFVFHDEFELVGGELALSSTMATFWTNFAATGDPNKGPDAGDVGGAPFGNCTTPQPHVAWPRFRKADDPYIDFDMCNVTTQTVCEHHWLLFDAAAETCSFASVS